MSVSNELLAAVKQKIEEIQTEKKTPSSNDRSTPLPSNNSGIKPTNKESLKDNDLINNIDDFDKDQWIKLRTSYANKLYWLLVGEIIALFLVILLIGMKQIEVEESTINITIMAIILQTFGLVKEIVNNLFKRNEH